VVHARSEEAIYIKAKKEKLLQLVACSPTAECGSVPLHNDIILACYTFPRRKIRESYILSVVVQSIISQKMLELKLLKFHLYLLVFNALYLNLHHNHNYHHQGMVTFDPFRSSTRLVDPSSVNSGVQWILFL
jgi:hypothetical protein